MQKVTDPGVPPADRPAACRVVVFAQTSPEARSLFDWSNCELEPLLLPALEVPVWEGLMASLAGQVGLCRVQTPLGEGLATVCRHRGPMSVLAVALGTAQTAATTAAADDGGREYLRVVAQAALTALQLKAARSQVTALRHDQERLLRQERVRAQAEVLRSFSHEFNNLLATVLLRAEMGLEAEPADQARQCFTSIYEAATHGAGIIAQLQDFSGGHPRPDQDLLDLGQLVSTCARERWEAYQSGDKGRLTLQVRAIEDLHVMASAADVGEIVGHLLDNAREATPEGGEVSVAVSREKRQAVVRVSDTGEGLSPEVLERACEPFFTTRGGTHLGLGLSVVHGTVTRSGGVFSLAGNDRGGAIATVRLPLADLRAVRRELRQKHEESGPLLRNLKVLVVDDEPGLRETLALSLETVGHRVSQAVDGRQALGLIRYHEGFDVLVVDLVMPEVDGWEVAYLARKLQPQAAVVLLTAWGEKLAENTEDRADAILPKPVSLKELDLALSDAVRRRRQAG